MGTKLLMIAGGGTGGHIYPAIAIARDYLRVAPERDVVFVGTPYGLEGSIVPKNGFRLELLSIGGLKGKSIAHTLRNLARLPWSLVGAWRLLSRYRPAAVLGVGGYASGPILLVAALRRIPTLIHESNAFPGITNRILAKFVTAVAAGFEEALPRLKRKDGVVTGNPVRREFFDAAAAKSTAEKSRLLVFGGSQGSRILNEAMTGALLFLGRLQGRLDIVHQTGPAMHEAVAKAYAGSDFARARVVPYLDAMPEEMASASLVVCRAGAMTVGELTAAGRASILVPFAQATNNHQELNARVLERAGAAVVITESELTPARLASAISETIGTPGKAEEMAERARSLARPEATTKIVGIIEKIERN